MNGQLLWFAAFFLYVYDSISLSDREAVLRYSIGGVTAKLTVPTLTVGRRPIFIPNPLRPDYSDLLLTSDNLAELSPLERYFISRASRIYVVHQVIAFCCLIVLFALTPFLATHMNLLYACLISVSITYYLSAFHWIEMWTNRRLLGIDAKIIRSDILHVLLCPPNAANCSRRIASLRCPSYGILACLRVFSRYDAEKYEEEFLRTRAST